MTFTLAHIEQLKRDGKIRGYNLNSSKSSSLKTGGRIVSKHFKKRSKEKDWIAWNLLYWANTHAVTLEEEYRFCERRFRFDHAIPSLKIAIEYNGIMSAKSRHTTVTGYTGDMNKLNAAQSLGWKVLQFTPLNYRNLIDELNKCL